MLMVERRVQSGKKTVLAPASPMGGIVFGIVMTKRRMRKDSENSGDLIAYQKVVQQSCPRPRVPKNEYGRVVDHRFSICLAIEQPIQYRKHRIQAAYVFGYRKHFIILK